MTIRYWQLDEKIILYFVFCIDRKIYFVFKRYRLFLSIACIDGKSDFAEVSKNLGKYKSGNITAKYNWALGVSAGCYIAQY